MKKILIVDDSGFTRNIHKQIITSQGYEVVEAGSGTEGVEMFSQEKPDLVMIDLLMPDMDGMEVVGKMLEIDPAAKTVICSTDKQKARQDDAQQIGVLAFLTKPVNAEKVAETLGRLLAD